MKQLLYIVNETLTTPGCPEIIYFFMITIAISEIVQIIEQCRYDDELSEGYKREILDQEKVYD